MQLKKLSNIHYVVVTDEPIKEGDWFYNPHLKEIHQAINPPYPSDMLKITHSTQPLNTKFNDWFDAKMIDLSYIKSLIGEIDVEKKAEEKYPYEVGYGVSDENIRIGELQGAYVNGYKECLEDNKDKRFSEKDMKKAIEMARTKECSKDVFGESILMYKFLWEEIISSLTQPKDTWEVEFIDGKLKLK